MEGDEQPLTVSKIRMLVLNLNQQNWNGLKDRIDSGISCIEAAVRALYTVLPVSYLGSEVTPIASIEISGKKSRMHRASSRC